PVSVDGVKHKGQLGIRTRDDGFDVVEARIGTARKLAPVFFSVEKPIHASLLHQRRINVSN
ncbi:hypothetical protein, partial [Streptomyces sp. NPDC050619]|uniref:hypothetical protein n=1 Tax=Streptomyces sp. NPDC050619 TaxID=3157214 RepID=UPI003427FD07